MVQTPGGSSLAGVSFGLSKPKTTGWIGRKNSVLKPKTGARNGPSDVPSGPVSGIPILSGWADHVLM